MLNRTENRRIAYSIAVPQHGVAARWQLIEAGLSPGMVRYWVETGRLLRVFIGVYALGRPVVRDEAIWMAATLVAGPTGVLAGRAAAAALGFGDPPNRVEAIRTDGARRLVHGCPPHSGVSVQIRRGLVNADELARVGPIPVTGADRTLADLAGGLSERALRRCFVEAGRQGLLTADCLARIEQSPRRYRGRGRLTALGRLWDPSKGPLRSVLESEFRLMCAEQRLPIPLTNQWIGGYEVDAVWPEAMLVVELDGRRFHADRFALARDSARTRALRAMGYTVLRFTWQEVTGSPEAVAHRIRQELARHTPGLLIPG